MNQRLILSPGPANISERVRLALTLPDIGHREAEFSSLLAETRELLLQVCGVPQGYRSVALTGSGTTAIEAALTSLKGVSRGLLILANGVYGERAGKIAEVFQLPFSIEKFGWTAPLLLEHVEDLIKTSSCDVVCLIHHETTTGILNPLRQVAALAKRHGKWVFVDAVSSVAGEDLDLPGWGIDLIVGSANKCIRGVPGISFVVLSEELFGFLNRSGRCRLSFCNDLVTMLAAQDAGETAFTPPVQTFYALREALRELIEEGVDRRIAAYRRIAQILRDGLTSLGLTFLVPRAHMSNTMTSVILPEGFSYESLHRPLKEAGYVIYKSQGNLAMTSFRLGTVGVVSEEDIHGFLRALRVLLSSPDVHSLSELNGRLNFADLHHKRLF